jgi:Dynein light chain type 1
MSAVESIRDNLSGAPSFGGGSAPHGGFVQTIAFEDQSKLPHDHHQLQGTVGPTPLDLSNLRFDIKSTDMNENMVLFVVEKTVMSFESANHDMFEKDKHEFKHDKDTLICQRLKYYLDSFYKPSWHVISGENYGSFFTHLKGHSIVYCFEGKWITAFKTA